ncbi:IS1634 family transposase [Caldalkalibacillus thermarum TA2.A1]|uniref:IS1634 family transposase n=1 Tax=Caldalkalibacillus thermarum (strain TA2.A1) TaxID=986075 RepID=A0A8X8I6T4_CALTT|nr:IS1634 family transposase [Caldalkalibacillus thermarum]QZT34737.1 IS1634 family transposase [Caldalkalibacillus thermarum TA2.A1]
MYIRRVTRKNKDGSVTAYLQLAHNEWDPKAKYAKAKVIYSFGREDEVDRAVLERLAKSISRFLSPEQAFEAREAIGEAADFLFQSCKRLGGVWMLHRLWNKLGMDRILQKLFASRHHQIDIERLIFAMVANRALAPSSKLAMEDWVREEVYIPGLPQAASHQLYRAMDELLDVQSELEYQVYGAVSDLLNLEVDLLYFDTTSSYFEVDPSEAPEGETLRKQGFSKDKRPDLLQVVIGLAVTREGIPIRCWVWPGNTMDMTVVEQVKKDLIGWKLGRVISVMDRGFSSEENLRTLQRAGGHYIVGEKMRSGKAATEEAMSRKGRYQQVRENLHVKEIIVGDGEARKRYVLVYNPKEAERQREERKKLLEKLQTELDGLKQLPHETHSKAACRLRSHPSYGKYLRQLKDGTLRINKQAIRDAEKYDGKYLIRTSDDTLSPEDVALGYKQLIEVEDAFRTLKSTLELRPMYHRLEDRIRAHILLSWLALLLVRIVEVHTGESWRKVRDELQRLSLGHFSSKNGDLCQCTEITAKQRQIFVAVGVEPPPRFLEIQPKS